MGGDSALGVCSLNQENATLSPTDSKLQSLIAKGIVASQAGHSAAAIDAFVEACRAAPTDGLAAFLLGSEYAAAGDVERAEAALADATRLAPDLSIARYQLGLLQFSSGRAAVALLTWEPLLAAGGAEPLGHFVLGHAALARDDFAEAREHYLRGLASGSTNAALAADIQKIVDRLPIQADAASAGQHGHAEESLAPQLARNPQHAEHVLLAGYQNQGRPH